MPHPADSLPGMPIVLRIFDVNQDGEIRKLTFKYNNQRHRKKINKTIFWALSSGHAIELVREQDDKD